MGADYETGSVKLPEVIRMFLRPPSHREHRCGHVFGDQRVEYRLGRLVADADIEDQRHLIAGRVSLSQPWRGLVVGDKETVGETRYAFPTDGEETVLRIAGGLERRSEGRGGEDIAVQRWAGANVHRIGAGDGRCAGAVREQTDDYECYNRENSSDCSQVVRPSSHHGL